MTQTALPPILKHLTLENFLLMAGAVVAARLIAAALKLGFTRAAEKSSPRWRIHILGWMPIARLLLVLATAAFIISLLIVPSWQNVVGLLAGAGLVLSFALKDYGSCLLAGLATIFERAYQPGDWVEIGGAYGEVRSIGLRSVRIVTLEDTEIIVPHSVIWASPVFNATSGNHTVLCVAEFFLHPDHDGLLVAGAAAGNRHDQPALAAGKFHRRRRGGTAVGHEIQAAGLCPRQPRAEEIHDRPDPARQSGLPGAGDQARTGRTGDAPVNGCVATPALAGLWLPARERVDKP